MLLFVVVVVARPTATCSTSFGRIWSLGSLTTLCSPTSGPWEPIWNVLAGECSYSYTFDQRMTLSSNSAGLPHRASFRRDARGVMKEEGTLAPPARPAESTLSSQWGDRHCRNITSHSKHLVLSLGFWFSFLVVLPDFQWGSKQIRNAVTYAVSHSGCDLAFLPGTCRNDVHLLCNQALRFLRWQLSCCLCAF